MPDSPTPKEIRERYSDYTEDWREIRDEAKTDMRYVAGDSWSQDDRGQRKDTGRPCLSLDELGQHLNQAINNYRQNPMAIKATPKSGQASDKGATQISDIIRGIEYRSDAQSCYLCGYENALQRSYGFARIVTKYEEGASFNQDIWIERVPNPDTILFNPDYKNADASDVKDAFATSLLRKDDFRRKYKDAKIENFGTEDMGGVEQWIRDNFVMLAEWWRCVMVPRKLLLIDGGELGPLPKWEDELPNLRGIKVLKHRMAESPKVTEYITNGVEILEEIPWAGSRIPIAACFGKEIFVEEGGKSKRKLLSMVRLARDPQQLFNYYATCQAEEAGQTPKAPFIGYVGQFETDAVAWDNATKVPVSRLQADPIVDAATGQVLPLPIRPQFSPNFQAYEIAKESARRSIQAALGTNPLPTQAQRQNEKSGVALKQIQSQESVGSFHFTDNARKFISNIGWQVNELVPIIYDTKRDLPVRRANEEHGMIRVNDPDAAAQQQQGGDTEHVNLQDESKYDITMSTGPNYQSQREAQSDFVDLLVSNLKALPMPPEVAVKVLALSIKLKNIGPIGDEIADLLDPQTGEELPPQAIAQIQQTQKQLQQMNAYSKQLEQKLSELMMEKQAKVVENQSRERIERYRIDKDSATKRDIAEITTKAQDERERKKLDAALDKTWHDTAHEIALQKDDQAHQQQVVDQQHQHTLEQGDQAAANQSALAQQQADNQPEAQQ